MQHSQSPPRAWTRSGKLVVLAAALVAACSDETPTAPPAPVPTSVTVSPSEAALESFGETVRLTAEVKDQNGQTMAGASVEWSSSAPGVVTVDASGVAAAVANGTATVTATAGSATASAQVTVAQKASSVTVSPAERTLAALGDTVRLRAEAADANGHPVAGAEFEWTSADAAVATVDGTGLATAVGNGTAAVTASAGGVSGSAEVTVAQEASSVTVSPAAETLAALGDTVRLRAEAADANGHPVAGAEFEWASSDSSVVGVNAAGLATAVGNGTATVAATVGSATASAAVTVAQVPAGPVVLVPDTASFGDAARLLGPNSLLITAVGAAVRVVPTGKDANGRALTAGAKVTWSSKNSAVATVDASGLVTAVANGRTDVTAASASLSVRVSDVALDVDRGPLIKLYEETGGDAWKNSANWLTDAPLEDWHGVGIDDEGRVTGLHLPANGLVGAIPPELGELANLRDLFLERNKLSGSIPPALGKLDKLQRLHLGGNSLTGAIPPELGNLASLEYMWMERNDLSSIPAALGNLANLKVLSLRINVLGGSVPSELGDLANLTALDLSFNRLTGAIPPELGKLVNLRGLSFWNNQLTGTIPPELGNLANLGGLELHGNDLTGAIPPELGNLANLTGLELQDNGLTGAIPSELGNLANLSKLRLNGNNLTGVIPPELGALSNLQDAVVNYNHLSGCFPPHWKHDAVNPQVRAGQDSKYDLPPCSG